MTREEKLYSMKMQDLVKVADKLGIKINVKSAKSEAIEKILAAEEMNKQNEKELAKEEAENDAYIAEVMQQKKDLGIECPKIDSYEVIEENLVPMPGAEKLAELKNEVAEKCESSMIDSTLLSKFTKKEQKIITMIYKGDDKLYHATAEHAGNKFNFDNKSLLKIGLEIRAIVKGV